MHFFLGRSFLHILQGVQDLQKIKTIDHFSFYSFLSEAIYELGSVLGTGDTNTNKKVSVLTLHGFTVTWGLDK